MAKVKHSVVSDPLEVTIHILRLRAQIQEQRRVRRLTRLVELADSLEAQLEQGRTVGIQPEPPAGLSGVGVYDDVDVEFSLTKGERLAESVVAKY